MRKYIKKIAKILGVILGLIVILFLGYYAISAYKVGQVYDELYDEVVTLEIDGVSFRDLNKNGVLDVYEDHRAPIEDRVQDVVSQMTLEEKAGTMFINMMGMRNTGELVDLPFIPSSPFDGLSLMMPRASEVLVEKKMNSFNTFHAYDAAIMAKFNNTIQKVAEKTRLGIPVTLATDPRHGVANNPGAAIYTPAFSEWPSFLGLAATRDTLLVREFGDMARQEYLSVGLRLALHPMADLATEPRWGRNNGTFGEDAHLSAQMTKAYVLGFQGDSLSKTSVACMTKHFSGGGAQKDGEDAHFEYGKEQVYPGDNFDYHIIPFEDGAFPAKTAQIMPYYGIPVGQTTEDVAFGFNKDVITGILRDSLGFDGVVCTDWNIITETFMGPGRAWGVEHLTELQRVKKVLDAGCDQFGGEAIPEMIVELVQSGEVPESRIDVSVARILRDKFRLGLFDNPYVDVDKAEKVAGAENFRVAGLKAQAKSTVLLKNSGQTLPLSTGIKLYVHGVDDKSPYANWATLVETPAEADMALVRVRTPFEERTDSFLERFFHQGRLFFTDGEKAEYLRVMETVPTVLVANLERPAILTDLDKEAVAVLAEFGTSEGVLADILFGKREPEGKLPFQLPSSWESVQTQKEDVPFDLEAPLYDFGHGLPN
ncbi:glycoside hydrolase family 3 protein [Sediminicola luteus]|uniref:beta-glucosidase n=1 Tax=Sediminicola luteus TaxID=319238 RepID=A0A2A4G6I6_9FLAO|nr:glycoside hydrolase family 3 N-terminal domain-containing protein [Sediminicola luteus]PCE64257.1 beta-glucosidase [Sediminicola luteus]